MKGSLTQDNEEDGLECSVNEDDFVVWIWIWMRMVGGIENTMEGAESGYFWISEDSRVFVAIQKTLEMLLHVERDTDPAREVTQEQ